MRRTEYVLRTSSSTLTPSSTDDKHPAQVVRLAHVQVRPRAGCRRQYGTSYAAAPGTWTCSTIPPSFSYEKEPIPGSHFGLWTLVSRAPLVPRSPSLVPRPSSPLLHVRVRPREEFAVLSVFQSPSLLVITFPALAGTRDETPCKGAGQTEGRTEGGQRRTGDGRRQTEDGQQTDAANGTDSTSTSTSQPMIL